MGVTVAFDLQLPPLLFMLCQEGLCSIPVSHMLLTFSLFYTVVGMIRLNTNILIQAFNCQERSKYVKEYICEFVYEVHIQRWGLQIYFECYVKYCAYFMRVSLVIPSNKHTAFLTLRYQSVSVHWMFRGSYRFQLHFCLHLPLHRTSYAFNEIPRKSNISPRCVWENSPGILKAALRLDVHF